MNYLPIAFALEKLGDLTPGALVECVDATMESFDTIDYDAIAYDLVSQMTGDEITCPTVTADGRLTEATYLLASFEAEDDNGQPQPAELQAVIDCAPLTQESEGDTYGVGVLIADALSRGATTIALLTDGVHTSDGGTGILVALGAQFYTDDGRMVARGKVEDIATIDAAQFNMQALGANYLVLGGADALLPAPTNCAQVCSVLDVDGTQVGMGAGGGIGLALSWIRPDAEHMIAPKALYIANLAGHLDPDVLAIAVVDEMTAEDITDPATAIGALAAGQVPMIVVARSVPAAFGKTGIIANMPVPTMVVEDTTTKAVTQTLTQAVQHFLRAQDEANAAPEDPA
ncbi:glycerate kinase [Corynebacterium aquilae]|uniref:glycerate kinase n=1 Tax=Corynebacterium aquilae TaxID=203263 RepID=UPI0009522C63|nr:glycerate kinase [Corynebacterium aquilae]